MRSADASLAARDPDLPLLPVVLDDDALGGWASGLLGRPVRARRRYVRLKPGTSAVAAVDLRSDAWGGPRRALVVLHGPDGADKLAGTLRRVPRHLLLGVDGVRPAALLLPAGDRELPALARLDDPGECSRLLRKVLGENVSGTSLRTLAWKPQRRWVGEVETTSGVRRVLRAYRRDDLRRAVAALRRARGDGPTTPRVVGVHERRALVALEHLPGTDLAHGATPDDVALAGAALARLHSQPLTAGRPDRGRRGAGPDGPAAAAARVGPLLPHLAGDARALAERVGGALRRSANLAPVLRHGDFSLDQVVLAADGRLGVLDLDAAGPGPAAADLAGAVAAAVADGGPLPGDVVRDALLDGYAAHRRPPSGADLGHHLAAALLRRAPEPFRRADPDWPAAVEHLVRRAAAVLEREPSGVGR